MAAVILDINDCGLLAQASGDVLLESPGFVTVEGRTPTIGVEAEAQVKLNPTRTEHQFWDKLGMDELVKPNLLARTQADLAYLHLETVWNNLREACSDLIVTVPGDLGREALGLLLGMCRRLDMPVRALVDTAVSASAQPAPGRRLYHLDLHLHRCLLTRLEQGAWLERAEVSTNREFGLARLRDLWSHKVAGLFVQATRFDPMHEAETEQWLYDRLGRWGAELAQHEHLDIDLPFQGRTHSVRLHRRQMVQAAEPLYRRLREFLADVLPAEQPVTLQLGHRVAELPGLLGMLESMPDVDLVVLDPLATRHGVSRLYLGHGDDGASVPYVARLPWFNARDLDAHDQGLAGYVRRAPTHLLHQAVAFPLRNGAFSVGADLAQGATGIRLAHPLPGVVAEHFRLQRRGEGVVLEDLSGGHTVVNDEPVSGSQDVHVGDRIRIGEPGTEFLLIAVDAGVDEGDGA